MNIEHIQIQLSQLITGYSNGLGDGVFALQGRLTVRPPYQREFIYNTERQRAVIDSVMSGLPLNSIYFAVNGDSYEVLDGQQRIMSICEFASGKYTVDVGGTEVMYSSLPSELHDAFNNYNLQVYLCSGTDQEKIKWFQRINIAGEPLTKQELRNVVYTGPWLTDAKFYFSKGATSLAYKKGYGAYITGASDRQEWLEVALQWTIDDTPESIEQHMARHQLDANANALITHFEAVMEWVKKLFPTYRREMKGLDWGALYTRHGHKGFLGAYDPRALENRILELMVDDDVTSKKGIYLYVLDGDSKDLNIRRFTESMCRAAYTLQKGVCARCNTPADIEDMEGDHITPWSLGGPTAADNLQMLCKTCNRRKSNA